MPWAGFSLRAPRRCEPSGGARCYRPQLCNSLVGVAFSSVILWMLIHMLGNMMSRFWRFLRDKRNQQVLGWLGGGLVVAATGLWAAFVYFFPPVKSPEATSLEPTPPSVQANCGGIAIG